MTSREIYDKASYHLEGDFPDELDPHQAFVPTGLFVAWAILRDLGSGEALEPFAEEIEALRKRSVSPCTFYRVAGGVFDSDLLSDQGNGFARAYFDFDKGAYLDDLDEVLGQNLPSFFHIRDSWENFDKLKGTLDQRFLQWKQA